MTKKQRVKEIARALRLAAESIAVIPEFACITIVTLDRNKHMVLSEDPVRNDVAIEAKMIFRTIFEEDAHAAMGDTRNVWFGSSTHPGNAKDRQTALLLAAELVESDPDYFEIVGHSPIKKYLKAIKEARKRAGSHNNFVEGCSDFLYDRGFLSAKQLKALANVTQNYSDRFDEVDFLQ